MSGIHVKFEVTPEQFVSDLTQATYDVMLKYGFKAPFIEVELGLHSAIRRVVHKDMMVSPNCGQPNCLAKAHYEWDSPEGRKILREVEL